MAPQAAGALTPGRRAQLVKARALALGFTSAGITDLTPVPHRDALRAWLAGGMAGTMSYMHRQEDRRADPSRIVPGATRAVVLTSNYYTPDPPAPPGTGRIAKYARGPDYHHALQAPLQSLCDLIRSLGPEPTTARAFVDAGPVPERELAQRAGLGWIGKNTMLIDPARGSFCFLASVLTDLDLAVDPPFEADRCGSCTRCLDACPTDAFAAPRVLDARRCISYLTIEHRGLIAAHLEAGVGSWLFGCDICQDVCPWNAKFAVLAGDGPLTPVPALAHIRVEDVERLDDADFSTRFGWTPLERPGAAGMRRNAGIVARNARKETAWREP